METSVLSAGTLSGDDIVNRDGDKLGTLKEIMIDMDRGTVAYGVLARGGLGSIGEKLFAVPWEMFTVNVEEHELILDIAEDVLDNSPGFDKDNWPTFGEEWRSDVHEYYGLVPNWRDR
jgi:sporulation protein YlmC with PRC-barrel domain